MSDHLSPAHQPSMQKSEPGASVSSAHGAYGHRGATFGPQSPIISPWGCPAPVEVDGRSGAQKSEAPGARRTRGLRLTRLKRAAPARWWRLKRPDSAVAPGPGRSADASTSPLPVPGIQNTDASLPLAGVPMVTAPAGAPDSLMLRQLVAPKQPNRCPLVLV